MPRTYDYDDETGPGDWLFPRREIAHRGSEVPIEVMWPEPLSCLSGRRPQFRLTCEEVSTFYNNAFADPVYDWLVENVRGQWHWFEHLLNNDRSIGTDVWIEDPTEWSAFETRWSDRIRRIDHAMAQDTAARSTESPRNAVPASSS